MTRLAPAPWRRLARMHACGQNAPMDPADAVPADHGPERDVPLALAGDAEALERLLRAVEPRIVALAHRMLGRREDALDATQEILLRIATHLSQFRGDSRFSTWAWRIAANALLDERRAQGRRRERSFSELAADIDAGMDRAETLPEAADPVTPEQRVAATELALVCTQGMLMALEGRQRLAYVLGEVMRFESDEAAQIAGVSAAAFRQQLARARQALRAFMEARCGLVSSGGRCHCDRQLLALAPRQAQWLHGQPRSAGAPMPVLHDAVARRGMQEVELLRAAARVFRAHPSVEPAEPLAPRVRALIAGTVFGAA